MQSNSQESVIYVREVVCWTLVARGLIKAKAGLVLSLLGSRGMVA